jgi:hypothetical protein
MKRTKAILYFLLVFFVGSLTSSIFEWLQPITTIEVTNASSKTIKYLDIEYKGMGNHKGRIAESLAPGKVVTFKWTTDSEASYRLYAIYEDNTEVKGGAGYTSRGDTVKESIYELEVISRVPEDFTFGFLYAVPRTTTYLNSTHEK